jgi:hypothetical protein
MRLLLVLCIIAGVVAFDVKSFVKEMGIGQTDSIPQMSVKFLEAVANRAEFFLKDHPEAKASEYAYWNFFPMMRASLVPDRKLYGPTVIKGTCFASIEAYAATQSDGSIRIDLNAGPAANETCYDSFVLITATTLEQIFVRKEGKSTEVFSVPTDDMTDAEKWDLSQKGIRVMQLMTDEVTTVANILETVKLFKPLTTQGVDDASAQRNADFINRYTDFHMEPRDPLSSVPPPAHEVHSGDFFGIVRLDGLDPMLAWAMGSTTGHTTVALWIDGELYICESTATTSYWYTNGIQKTPYLTWMQQAQEANMNVVWAPLSPRLRDAFNTTAAIDFFRSVEGVDYGYYNMLWAWIDTLYDNYPCVAPDFSSVCLTWELVEPLFAIIDRNIPQLADVLYNQAFNKHIGTSGLRTAEIYRTASVDHSIVSRMIPAIVEQDAWLYNTTRYGQPYEGPSNVCCVFVCNTWKHGGLFDGMDVNCVEQTNVDDYSLNFFQDTAQGGGYRQILGSWTLDLNRFNSRPPNSHMHETCSSEAPHYEQSATC